MTDYQAPLADLRFALDEVVAFDQIAALPGYEDATEDLVSAILEEAGRFSSEVLAPLNHLGDQQGSHLVNGVVRTPDGFQEAYRQFAEGGWNGLPFDPAYGGQGLPWTLAIAVQEMWQASNMSFAICPLLNQGAVDLLQAHGNEAQKQHYMSKMISGEWSGTMNLTEPQAGSDVGAVRTRAEPRDDHYRIHGQKIFITYGEHDLAENIVHMVLARIPGAPAGTKGLSLFIVPKFLVKDDGSLGEHNDLRCLSLEQKLGIHASPTTVMSYGDNGGAIGHLIGEAGHGMSYMFTMMNNARLSVGLQGVAIAERAYQQALAYARERRQGAELAGTDGAPVPIIRHPDVRRMVMTMKVQTEALRLLTLFTAAAVDRARRSVDESERARQQDMVDVLIPVVKAWCTDVGCEVASLGVQIHGGAGFIEEAGAAQYYRDARIAPIYEGTNGIQAMDLLIRKLLRDEGQAVNGLIDQMRQTLNVLGESEAAALKALYGAFGEGLLTLEAATDFLLDLGPRDLPAAAAGATPYLKLMGTVVGGWLLAKAALAANEAIAKDTGSYALSFLEAKITTSQFYAANILPGAALYGTQVIQGSKSTLALDESAL